MADRQAAGAALSGHLRRFLEGRWGPGGRTLSGYWPIQGEPDLRAQMEELHGRGVAIALPVVEAKAATLAFRRWSPGMSMVRDAWSIPVPPPQSEAVTPGIALVPLVGWDGAGFRLGHGGGYFDRTLAALSPRPLTIGVGLQSARLATIFPQPHDIALDVILTEAGVQFLRAGA